MKILVTGKNGQVGHELMRSLDSLGDLVGVDVEDCDLTNIDAIEKLLERIKPDLIVNTAAYTAVDKAESDLGNAYAINVIAPEVFAKYASRKNIPIIHYSTDYVFDGTKEEPYVETDVAKTKSVYGQTKQLGEVAVRRHAPKHFILRTSWIFGVHGLNFLKTTLKLAQERDKLSVVSDQVGSPTSASLIADITAEIVKRLFESATSQKYGTYHVVSDGEVSWHGYAQYIVKVANKQGLNTRLAVEKISPVATKDYPLEAYRPLNSRLDTSKIRAAFNIQLPSWENQVDQVINTLLHK